MYLKRHTKIKDIQSVNVTVHTAEQSDRQKETINNSRQTQNRIKPPKLVIIIKSNVFRL